MKLELTDHTIALRTIHKKDNDTLLRIYASTRLEELKLATNWSEELKQKFLAFQFKAQHDYYQEIYTGAHFWMIEKNGAPIGRLYLDESFENKTVRIIDITLLPEWRSKGIGHQLLRDIIHFSNRLNRPVSIHVESFNPAMNLYKKLGFELIDITNGVYHLLERKNNQMVYTL